MLCPSCYSPCHKAGKHINGLQRFRCKNCKRRFAEPQRRPLGNMRIPLDKALLALNLLVEGASIRGISRVVGLEKKTVISLLLHAGQRAETRMDARVRKVRVKDVQVDELWGFVFCKQWTKNALRPTDPNVGDIYCFVAIERETKLVLAWHLGRRSSEDTEIFVKKLGSATAGHFQLTTDGFQKYPSPLKFWLGDRVDYAQAIKMYGRAHIHQSPEGERRYSPRPMTEVIKTPYFGKPDPSRISTSHVERQNLTIRMMMRRLTRLTNAFSKKMENLRAALGLHFGFYNFCRIHQTLRCTPAMAAGVAKTVWKWEDLIG